MIILFPSTETLFTSNGLGRLTDAISCVVSEGANDAFELEMEYPINGIHYSDISLREIILTKPNPYADPQPFRIYDITKPINGIVTIYAQHISYDTSGYPASPFSANTATDTFINMKNAAVIQCPFTFDTNILTSAALEIKKPTSIRSILGNEILKTYGGEYEFDKFAVHLHSQRGQNRGVSIRYGKNLTDLKQEENCSSVYTGVYPFWYSEQDGLVQLTEKVLNAPGTYDFTKIYPLDLSGTFNQKPTEDELRAEANKFMTDNNIGIPVVSITVSFIQLGQSEEYKNFATLETVKLCDTVSVDFPKLGVSASARCIKTTYNVLTDKYESLDLGEVKSNIAATIAAGSTAINKKIDQTTIMFDQEVGTLKIGLEDVNTALIKKAEIDYVDAQDATINSAVIKKADMDVVNANFAHLKNGALDMAQIGQASIVAAMIESLDVTQINSGDIDTKKFTIKGTNGRLQIIDNKLQVFDSANNVLFERVVMGDVYNNGTKYGLLVRGADGKTILFDETGITDAGFTSGYDKLTDGTLNPAKLDITQVVTLINDGETTINASMIKLTDDTLDLEIKSIRDIQSAQGDTINDNSTAIQALNNKIVLKAEESEITTINGTLKTYDQRITTVSTQANGLSVDVGSVKTRMDTAEGQLNTINTHFDFQTDGLTIGKDGSPFTITISNSEMDFKDGQKVVAYVNGQQMLISQADIDVLLVGVHKIWAYDADTTVVKFVG